jgi:hypothetical protein
MNNQQAKNKTAIKRSAYRATTQFAKPSKEKHVRILVLQTFNRDGSVDEIIKSLVKRMEKQNWAVVIKALMIFHRCFRDGDPGFIEAMKPRSNLVFALRTFSSLAPPNHLFTVFVKKYAKYLEEKVSVLRLLGYQFEKNQDAVKKLKGQAVYKVVPKLQSQLNALLNCKLKAQHAGAHVLINHALILLCQDSLVLYSLLHDQVVKLVDAYWKMNRKDATRALNVYKLFVKETDALIGLYDIAKQFIRQLPSVNKADSSIVDQMEKYLESVGGALDSDDEGNGRKKGRKKGARDDDSDDDSNEMLNTRNEQYDERDYGANYDDDEEESSGSEDDAPDYFKDFFAGMPSMANNPFGAQPRAPPTNIYGSQNSPLMGQPSSFGTSPFSSQPGASPFAAQSRPSASPFASQSGSPFTPAPSPYGTGSPSPFGSSAPPFGSVAANPFAPAAQPANPFAGSASSPAANPFAPSGASAFGGSLVIANQPNSFASNPFGGSAFGGSSFTQPPQPANPFATPQSSYGSSSAFGQPTQQAANPFL